jgi:sugar (pentulose or hexulose) kinase
MARILGLDIGTTSISGVVLETDDGKLIARTTREHRADVTPSAPHEATWAEQDPAKLWACACDVLRELAGVTGSRIAAIGLTGQMHGVVLVDSKGDPIGNLITWQDRRSAGIVDELIAAAPAEAWQGTGCRLATGYMGATLAWMVRNDALPKKAQRACFIHDWIASRLAGSSCCTDPSDAASAGILDLSTKAWSPRLVDALRLPGELLPDVRESGKVVGQLRRELADDLGLIAGAAVCNAIGDNQASFLGSVADPPSSVLVNIGTGGQISWLVDDLVHPPGMEVRYLPIDRLIAVGAGICGGRTYAWLETFYRQVIESFMGETLPHGQLYERMNELAAEAPAGAGGLRCRPTLAGTRMDPHLRGCLEGLDLVNFTPLHLTRAVLAGIIDELLGFYQSCPPARRSGHRVVIGSGNAVRRNRVLADILAQRLGMPVRTPVHLEEAAYGAALLAAVSCGVLPDLTTAGRLIGYHAMA